MGSKISVSKLVDVADVVDSLHKTPKYSSLGYPMVRCVDLGYGPLNLSNTNSVAEDVYTEYSRRYAPAKGDIIITRVGANFGVTSYAEETNFCLGQNTAAIIPKINPDYLYYILNSAKCRHQMNVLVAGAAQPTLSLKAIKALDIPRLGCDIENKIADIIGNINDKININKKTNQTLEKMAQTLFKSWFVDFDPVFDNLLAKVDFKLENLAKDFPEVLFKRAQKRLLALDDSAKGALLSILKASTPFPVSSSVILEDQKLENKKSKDKKLEGTNPQGEQSQNNLSQKNIHQHFPSEFVHNEQLGWIPKGWCVLALSDILEVKYGKDHKKLNDGYFPVYGSGGLMRCAEQYLYNGESVLIPRKGTLSNIMYIDRKFWTVDTMFYTIPKIPNIAKFAFHHLKRLDFTSMNVGSAVPSMTTKVLNHLLILKPSDSLLKIFDDILTVKLNKINSNLGETEQLEKLRDTLLPKLISGELHIPDVKAADVTRSHALRDNAEENVNV